MTPIRISESAKGVVVGIKVVPSSSKTRIAGMLDGMIKVTVAAAPEKGKANKCLTDLLAKKLSLKKKNVRVVSGMTSQIKKIEITGLTAEQVAAKLCETNDKDQND